MRCWPGGSRAGWLRACREPVRLAQACGGGRWARRRACCVVERVSLSANTSRQDHAPGGVGVFFGANMRARLLRRREIGLALVRERDKERVTTVTTGRGRSDGNP